MCKVALKSFQFSVFSENSTYNRSLGNVIEKDEVAEHGDEAEKSKPGHNVDHRVFQVKFSCLFFYAVTYLNQVFDNVHLLSLEQ